MKIENKSIEIEFKTEDNNKYNYIFMNNIYNKLNKEKEEILERLEIKECRKVKINLYDSRTAFIEDIEKFYKKYEIPQYCRGTTQDGQIYFLVNNQVEENTYRYEIELRKIIHEYIHILYEEYISEGKNRVIWLDEGIALNLSKEKGKFIRERFPVLNEELKKFNLNELSHEKGTFFTKDINGYDISYLAVKYLMETLSKDEFNKLIRDNKRICKLRKNNLATSKRLFSKKVLTKNIPCYTMHKSIAILCICFCKRL